VIAVLGLRAATKRCRSSAVQAGWQTSETGTRPVSGLLVNPGPVSYAPLHESARTHSEQRDEMPQT